MTAGKLEALRARLREIDRDILRALEARARRPRRPLPAWPAGETRLPPPPLAEILPAISAAGTAAPPPDAENQALVSALLASQHLAREMAEAKFNLLREDVCAAMESDDRDRLLGLLTDLPADVRRLDQVRTDAINTTPGLAPDMAGLLWREYLVPWTRQSQVAHLLAP